MKFRMILVGVLTIWASAEIAPASPPEMAFAAGFDESNQYQVEVLLTGLDNPAGLAIRPTGGSAGLREVFFSESGAGQVVRFTDDSDKKVQPVITRFDVSMIPLEEGYRLGPLGLQFLTSQKIVVADCGGEAGSDRIRVYEIGESAEALEAQDADHSVGPVRAGDTWQDAQHLFFSMAVADKTLYLTTGPFDGKSFLFKAGIKAGRLEYLQTYVDPNRSPELSFPGAIARLPSSRPAYIIVGQMGAADHRKDSLLTFYLPATGEPILTLGTGLHDLIGLAYSPSGQLYAVDAAWNSDESGGVFRLDDARVDGKQACRPVKIADVVKPTSLAFSPKGELYVTAWGAGKNESQGQLIKITGGF